MDQTPTKPTVNDIEEVTYSFGFKKIYLSFFRLAGLICAIICFIGTLKWSILYYTFLRWSVSIGSLLIIYKWFKQKNYYLITVFTLVLIILNPLYPIYFYSKSVWILFDLITGFLFLLVSLLNKKNIKKQLEVEEPKSKIRIYSRDRILSVKSSINNTQNSKL